MDDDQQQHVVDASLLSLQEIGNNIQVLNENSEISYRHPSSSGSSHTIMSVNDTERKRKRMETASSNEDGASKKIRIASIDQERSDVSPDMSCQLPAEVWQHVFSLLPPHTLGALLCVNRLFHKYLDPASPFKVAAPAFREPSILPALYPDAIWRASRCRFWPKMPAPLWGKTELDMWRFACSRSCQICGQLDETDTAWDSLPWHRGPGNNTVSPVFPFFINSCGNCLVEISVKEVEMLLSTSVPSVIIPGLPMIFLTPDLNVVYPQTVRSTQVPTSAQLTKVYWPTQVEGLQAELEAVKRFGPAATEEWIKGLEVRGVEAIHGASRWERWYLSGGVHQMLRRSSSAPPIPTNRRFSSDMRNGGEATVGKDLAATPLRRNPKRRAQEVVEELKSQRRADIEARVARLQPPIPPSVLSDLPSFQIALQKIEPFHDKEWKGLKSQLLAQYKKTRKKEKKSTSNTEVLEKHQSDSMTKDNKGLAHQSLHDTETLVRIRISTLTDQFMRDHWGEGRRIKQKDCARFTIGVFAYVHKHFNAEFSKPDAASSTRRLILDDMKWIFDNKIKLLINHFPQEFFLCSGCSNPKLFGFHAVIQHYASKHVEKKLRNQHWRVEWTEKPPFRSSAMQQVSTVDSKPPPSHDSEDVDAYKSRVVTMAKVLKSVWQVFKKVQNIPTSAKMRVLIHHVVKGYQEDYLEPAPFEMFLDVLNQPESSSAVSSYHGLACKVCMLSQTQDEDEKSLFSLSTLAKHFHDVHNKERIPPMDWRVDMVWLPDMQISQGLQPNTWKNKRAFELTSEALPWLFESEDAMSQSGSVSLRTLHSPIATNLEAVNTVAAPVTHHYADESFLLDEDVPRLLPASVVYTRQPSHNADASQAQNIGGIIFQDYEALDNSRAQYMVREPGMGSGSIWGAAQINSRPFSSRDIVSEPRRRLNTYYLHNEHELRVVERPSRYPYYPDVELQREQSHTEVGTGYTGSRYYMSSDHQQPTSSAPLYHYVESIPSYDRYGIVDAQGVSNDYYTEHPTIIHGYRIPSNSDRFNHTNLEHNNTASQQRVYDAYASRYTLANRRSGV
ncbi:hypothetical protein ACHAQJ_007061 [Trichoderma viride]